MIATVCVLVLAVDYLCVRVAMLQAALDDLDRLRLIDAEFLDDTALQTRLNAEHLAQVRQRLHARDVTLN